MTRSELVRVVSRELRQGAKSVQGALTVTQIKYLIVRVLDARPEDLAGYAFMAGRNQAISDHRAQQAALRRLAREAQLASQALSDALRRWEEEQDQRLAREQFPAFVQSLPPSEAVTMDEQLEMVRLRVIQSASSEDVASAFPDSSPNQRDQWKRRGVKRMLKHDPPPELRRVLERSTFNS